MNRNKSFTATISKNKIRILAVSLIACIFITLLMDYVESRLNNYSYYFSESFLFSSFWWLFPPLLFVQFSFVESKKPNLILLIALPVFIHLISYPALIWVIASLFFNHTFAYGQTLQFALERHIFTVLILYSVPLLLYKFLKKDGSVWKNFQIKDSEKIPTFSTLVVKEGDRHIHIKTNEVNYFSANPPYINIHQDGKKFLYQDTLKSLSMKLDPDVFVRIHKSIIVNRTQVHSHQSRLNGDYDVLMKNGETLRLSRNYVKGFRSVWENKGNNGEI